MSVKIMSAAMALAIAGSAMMAPTTADAQWRRGRGGGGGAVIGGLVAGAIVGGAIAANRGGYYGPGYYGPGYGPGPGPAYYAPGGYDGPDGGDATAYCLSRFKSYDPRSGTYLGFDGARHPCPE